MDLNTFKEYLNIHLISLEQDLEENPTSDNVIDIEGQIHATKHFIEVLNDN
jgi:hypothetical protein